MVVFPNTQQKAQAELDEVVGRGRLPTFADYERLPYIRAIIKETLRWRPVVPMALPHLLTQDDIYNGYYIPKGTICIPNVWQVPKMSYTVTGADDEEMQGYEP